MNTPTDWISAVVILAAGLILGMLFVMFFNKRKAARTHRGDVDLERKDLEAKRDALIAQLRDPSLTPDERTRLELETAAALRALDQHVPAETALHAAPSSGGAMNPTVKGFLYGAGSFAALAILVWYVMQAAAPRQEGGSLTGDIGTASQAPMQQQQPGAQDPMVRQLEAAVQQQPDNLQLRNDLAQAYLERDNMMGVFEQTRFVLARAPNDSRALTFQGLVRMAMGEGDTARNMLQQATRADAKNLDAWVALAWLHVQQDNLNEAEASIAQAAKQSPADKARLDEVFGQMKQHAAQAKNQPPQSAAGGGLPEGHPPVGGGAAPQPMATPAGGEKSLQVTIDVAASARQKSGVLFVIARPPAGGPPAAVKRLQVTSFPVTFAFGSADSMMGQPLPDTFRLEARLDSDGDPLTKPATDPQGALDRVTAGTNVRLALK